MTGWTRAKKLYIQSEHDDGIASGKRRGLVGEGLDLGLGAFAADATRQLNVFGHDGYSLGVHGTEVGIFKQRDEVGLAGFLERENGGALEP